MSTLGDFFTGMVMRSHQGTQDRAALNTLAKFSDDQDSAHTEKLAQRGKQASALRNVIKSYSDNPDLGQAINSLGVDQLEGIMHGMALSSAMKQQEAAAAQHDAETQWYNQRTKNADEETGALSRFASAVDTEMHPQAALPANGANAALALGQMMQGGPANFAPFAQLAESATAQPKSFNEASLAAMSKMGRTDPRMGGIMMGKLLGSYAGNDDLTPGEFTTKTGATFAYRGKQMFPAGYVQPKGGEDGLQELTTPGGKLLGFAHTDRRGHETIIKPPPSMTLIQARDESGAAIPGSYLDDKGMPHKLKDTIQMIMEEKGRAPTEDEQKGIWSSLFGGGDKPAKQDEKAASAEPLPGDRKQWVVGKKYLTNKGELTWNGTKFVR